MNNVQSSHFIIVRANRIGRTEFPPQPTTFKRHRTVDEARAEAMRLAMAQPEEEFIIYKAVEGHITRINPHIHISYTGKGTPDADR